MFDGKHCVIPLTQTPDTININIIPYRKLPERIPSPARKWENLVLTLWATAMQRGVVWLKTEQLVLACSAFSLRLFKLFKSAMKCFYPQVDLVNSTLAVIWKIYSLSNLLTKPKILVIPCIQNKVPGRCETVISDSSKCESLYYIICSAPWRCLTAFSIK